MSRRRPKSGKKKKKPHSAILVSRRAFLEALKITSTVLQLMGDEFESVRSASNIPVDEKQAILGVVGTHMKNVSTISDAFQAALYDPIDPDGTLGQALN